MTLSSPHEHLLNYYDSSYIAVDDDDVGSSINDNGGGGIIGGGELLSTNDDGRGFAMLHRLLAGDDAPTVDYAVLGIVVITLGLVLLVEAVRHSLDVAASGHKFFQTVLELVYREITTLGLVELILHVIHEYGGGMNSQLEAIFLNVHFMLFFTAIFNALQSCVVRLLTIRKTNKSWLTTEDIEISHYIAVRKDFDRLERQLKTVNPKYMGSLTQRERQPPTDYSTSCDVPHQQQQQKQSSSSSSSSTLWKSIKESLSHLALRIRHPRLYRRRDKLLTIVRFHELRAHFIESNNLPAKFQVSTYLDRSLKSDLIDFVHISPVAWISCMATTNFIFFISGMILNDTENKQNVEDFLLYIFISLPMLFVVTILVLYCKMRIILYKIQHLKLDDPESAQRFTALNKGTIESFDQLNLFWGANPRVVITITQYIQFWYAIGLAGAFVYFPKWDGFQAIQKGEFLGVLLLSYAIFSKVMSEIIPLYTLCTSMGQLVNKEILNETLAKLRLSEEIRKQEALEEERIAEEELARRRREFEENRAKAKRDLMASESRKNRKLKKTKSDGVAVMRSKMFFLMPSDSSPITDSAQKQFLTDYYLAIAQTGGMEESRDWRVDLENNPDLQKYLKDLASTNPDARNIPDAEKAKILGHHRDFESLFNNDQPDTSFVIPVRPRRVKSQSAGVAAMGLMGVKSSDKIDTIDHYKALVEMTRMHAGDLPETEPLVAADDHADIAADIITGFMRPQSMLDFNMAVESAKIDGQSSYKTNALFSSEAPPDIFALDDDGESDIDNVPEAMVSDEKTTARRAKVKGIDLHQFFQSQNYKTLSFLLGPMVCSWIIARIEVFNIAEGIFIDQTNLWYQEAEELFWLEVFSYCAMIFEMFLILVVFMRNRDKAGLLSACSAAVFGLVIVIMCMTLLFVAESKRCCKDPGLEGSSAKAEDDYHRLLAAKSSDDPCEHRLLGPASTSTDDLPCDSSSYTYHDDIICTCPGIGARKYGGLGDIEPWTFLILLYSLRFYFAAGIVAIFGSKKHHVEKHKWHHHHGHGHDIDSFKFRDSWLTVVGIHHEIAEKFGFFSGEILLCMLGVPCPATLTPPLKTNNDDGKELGARSRLISEEKAVDHDDKKPAGLVPAHDILQSFRHSTNQVPPSPGDITDATFDDFSYPTARLILRVRRCERLLLPLLGEWIVVDVAITKHELILFNVVDEDDEEYFSSMGLDTADQCSFSNGGMGMPLCEVARGRKVVSKFDIDLIDLVNIEHRVAMSQKDNSTVDAEANRDADLMECWHGGGNTIDGYKASAMTTRWSCVNEDRLKIHFKHNTLFLRFFADLNGMEQEMSKGTNQQIVGDNVGAEAKVWCCTIARLRGASNLRRQSLPHFGADVADEIEDFIEPVDRTQPHHHLHHHHHGHRRNLSSSFNGATHSVRGSINGHRRNMSSSLSGSFHLPGHS